MVHGVQMGGVGPTQEQKASMDEEEEGNEEMNQEDSSPGDRKNDWEGEGNDGGNGEGGELSPEKKDETERPGKKMRITDDFEQCACGSNEKEEGMDNLLQQNEKKHNGKEELQGDNDVMDITVAPDEEQQEEEKWKKKKKKNKNKEKNKNNNSEIMRTK